MRMRSRSLLPFLILCLYLFAGCNSDSGDGENPGLSVPIRPSPGTEKLSLKAELEGQYVSGLQIEPWDWSSVGPGEAILITFKGIGMQGIGQFDIVLEAEPSTQFDIAASAFAPEQPFVTLLTGVEQQEDGKIRLIGVDLNRSTDGDAVLGTLSLKTTASFRTSDELRLRVVFFSIGPLTTARDNFVAEDLGMGIVVNGQ